MGNYCEFRPVIQELSFKDISYLELWWQIICSAKWKHLYNIGRRYGELFCEIILNLDLWLRRKCYLKMFLI